MATFFSLLSELTFSAVICVQTSPARLKQICQCGFMACDLGFFGMKLAVTSITILNIHAVKC